MAERAAQTPVPNRAHHGGDILRFPGRVCAPFGRALFADTVLPFCRPFLPPVLFLGVHNEFGDLCFLSPKNPAILISARSFLADPGNCFSPLMYTKYFLVSGQIWQLTVLLLRAQEKRQSKGRGQVLHFEKLLPRLRWQQSAAGWFWRQVRSAKSCLLSARGVSCTDGLVLEPFFRVSHFTYCLPESHI